jgi:hypothetical protein
MAAWILLALLTRADLSPEPAIPAAIHVRIDQDGRLSPFEMRIVVEEIEKIWGSAGVHVTSGRYSDPVPSGAVTLSMRILSVELPDDYGHVLGWVVGDIVQQSTPTIFISRAAVTELLAKATFKGVSFNACPHVLRSRLVAQAIGRVAAHELGHYVLTGREHDQRGLMRPTYNAPDLVSSGRNAFRIAPNQHATLRREVAGLRDRRAH